MEKELTIAMLIDADNTQKSKMEAAILEVSTMGRILVKRAYGNWSKEILKNWEEDFRKLAIKPIQQIDYVKGKNATDMALTIDAMDFLYNSDYDIFALVTSDSDFTPLAIKIRESGKLVIGIGSEKSSEAFIKSCDKFIYLEKLQNYSAEAEQKDEKSVRKNDVENRKTTELDNLLMIASNVYQDEEGYTNVSAAGAYIKRVKPDFDISVYGARKIPSYLRNNPEKYEVKEYKGKGIVKIIAYKLI